MNNPDTPTTIKIPTRTFFSLAWPNILIRTFGWRRGLGDWLTMMASVPAALVRFAGRDAVRRWNTEPTEADALRLFLVLLPIGVALIFIAIGNGFGYQPW